MASKHPPSAGQVDPAIIADLAAAARILAARGVVDGFGHVSMRHPTASDRYLMAKSLAPALVKPADIIEYTLDSDPCEDLGRSSFLERFIHGEIYKMRPDINAVVHSHSPSVIPFGLVKNQMKAMFHNAAFLAAGVPIFDIRQSFGMTNMLVCDCAKGLALAETLEDKHVALMRAHGSVATGDSLQTAVFRAVYTEVNARIQLSAISIAEDGGIEALAPEEGVLADEINKTAGIRAWNLWRMEIRSQNNW